MALLASLLIVVIYFAIAEVLYKKATGHYFDFGYGVHNREGIIMTLIVAGLALGTAPFIVPLILELFH